PRDLPGVVPGAGRAGRLVPAARARAPGPQPGGRRGGDGGLRDRVESRGNRADTVPAVRASGSSAVNSAHRGVDQSRSGPDRELDLAGVLDDLRRLQDLEPHDLAIVPEIRDDAGADLVTFLDSGLTQPDGQGVGLRVVGDLHPVAPLEYL